MVKKLRQRRKQDKEYEENVKKIIKNKKPLGKPLPNKFLTLMIKNHIVNDD